MEESKNAYRILVRKPHKTISLEDREEDREGGSNETEFKEPRCEDGRREHYRNVVLSLFWNIRQRTKSRKPVVLIEIYHRILQN
jgi:hypothetical protein